MKTYYGLRLVSIVFLAASIVVSISTVATIGGLWGMSLVGESEFSGTQAIIALITGGIIALVTYAFGQLIDLQLNNYKTAARLVEEIENANKLNDRAVKLLTHQTKIMHAEFDLNKGPEMRKIEKQLDERRDNLR